MKHYLIPIILVIATILSVLYIANLAEWFIQWWYKPEIFWYSKRAQRHCTTLPPPDNGDALSHHISFAYYSHKYYQPPLLIVC